MFHILKARSKISIFKLKLTIPKLIFYIAENIMYNNGKKYAQNKSIELTLHDILFAVMLCLPWPTYYTLNQPVIKIPLIDYKHDLQRWTY